MVRNNNLFGEESFTFSRLTFFKFFYSSLLCCIFFQHSTVKLTCSIRAPTVKLTCSLNMYGLMITGKGEIYFRSTLSFIYSNSLIHSIFTQSFIRSFIQLFNSFQLFFRYDEVCSDEFSFTNANTLSKATAFTQMIWKDTNTIGVAKATSKDGAESCSFIAAVYRPAGKNPFIADHVFFTNINSQDQRTYKI